MAQKIIIICGEASGDLNAGNLAAAIKELNPDIKISGVGGIYLRNTGAEIYYDIKDIAVIGFFDAIKNLPRFFALQKLLLKKIEAERPDAIILIDFSGFNLRLAKKIDKAIPIIYYISPQVWASRPGRIKTIKRNISKMVVLFKFEEEFYKRQGIDVEFAGHPLLDVVFPTMKKEDFLKKFGLSESKTTIALFPGSRNQEIKNILPVMLHSADLIAKTINNIQFVIAKTPNLDWEIYNTLINNLNLNINLRIVEGKTYDCLESADFCLVASGTATLEAAIMQKPFVVIYKMNPLNYLLYRPQVKLPFIGIVNIVAQRKIIPEFIQFHATPAKISHQVLEILKNPSRIQQMQDDLAQFKSLLGERGAARRAAGIITNFINK